MERTPDRDRENGLRSEATPGQRRVDNTEARHRDNDLEHGSKSDVSSGSSSLHDVCIGYNRTENKGGGSQEQHADESAVKGRGQSQLETAVHVGIRYWAEEYTERGLTVIPLCHASHGCSKPGKVPYDPSKKIHRKRWNTPEPFSSRTWEEWDKQGPLNIGILTGRRSKIVGVDIDGSENVRYFEDYVKCRIDEIPTWAFATGNGYRLLYRWNGDHSFPSFNIKEGDRQIEILGDGKQTVAPPSVHFSGRTYRWLELRSPFVLEEPLDCPEWILDCVGNTTQITSESEPSIDWSAVVAQGIESGGRNEGLTKVLGRVLSPVPLDIDTFYQVAKCLNDGMCRPPLDDRELTTIVKSLYKRETIQQAQAEHNGIQHGHSEGEIRAAMKNYMVNRSEAIMLLDSL